MTCKGLHSFAGSNVPKFCKCVASSRDKYVLICRVDADTHDVSQVISEFRNFGPSLDIPQHACHVSRRRNDAAIIDESTAREVARVSRELPRYAGRPFTRREIIDGADIIETATSHIIAAWSVGTGHHPR